MYRYTIKVYRYTRSEFGMMGFLIQELGAFSHSKHFLTLHKPSPSRLFSHTSLHKLGCFCQGFLCPGPDSVLQSLYGLCKPPTNPYLHCWSHPCYTWICFVGFGWYCFVLGGWEFQLLEWAGKCCLMCIGPARCCSK